MVCYIHRTISMLACLLPWFGQRNTTQQSMAQEYRENGHGIIYTYRTAPYVETMGLLDDSLCVKLMPAQDKLVYYYIRYVHAVSAVTNIHLLLDTHGV